MIRRRLTKYVVAALTVLLTSLGLTAITPADALDGNKFDPGLIISDSVFFDFGTMTVEEIQRFLESQVPVCKSGTSGMPCLRNYRTDTPEKSADPGKCAYLPAQKDISAAAIIYNISRACGINPRVLLVTLQKEQGLVQASIPSPYMYRAAMGYGCPDSDPGICGKVWTGLFNQLYKAAGQFQWYGDPNGSFTYLRPGREVSISYHPDASRNCGKKTFTLKSQATANLYYYTPFVPNTAALNNLRGTGDSCSAYGNRNFWRYYWDWFGSPLGGGFLLKSSTSDTYFISNDIKYPLADPGLVTELAPLGPLGEISKEYLDSFPTGTPMTRLIKTAPVGGVSTYYFVSSGKKYVVANCEQATNLGLDCNAAITLTQVQLDALPTGAFRPDITGIVKSIPVAPATASYYMVNASKKYPVDCGKAPVLGFSCTNAQALDDAKLNALATVRLGVAGLGISPLINLEDGTRVLIQAGQKREILDDASLSAAGVGPTAPSPLKLKDFNYLPWGAPIALDGSLFVNRELQREGVIVNGNYFDIDPVTRAEIDFTKLFKQTPGSLGADGLSAIPHTAQIKTLVVDERSQTWLLNADGKTKVDDTSNWITAASPITNDLADKFPTLEQTITGFNFVQVKGQKTVYLLKDGIIRATYNAADRDLLDVGMSSTNPVLVTLSGLTYIPKGVMVLPAGLVVKNKQSGVVGLIDGPSRIVTISDTSMALTLPEPRALTNLQLIGYQDQEALASFKLSCAGQKYIVANSLLHEAQVAVAKDFPGKTTPLSDASCARLTITDQSIGHYVGEKILDPKTNKLTYKAYKIIKGKRYPFKNMASYKKDNLTEPPLIWVDQSFLRNLPLGNEIGAVTVDPKPDPKPTPKPKTYTIVAGDSLSSIALKFKTTVSKIMTLNNIVNADRIKIGQVLKLP